MIIPNSLILFQGDSITDAGRDKTILQANTPSGMGHGYCNLIAAKLLREHPRDGLKFMNRGVGGDRIVDLYARWKSDAINLRPDVISILVGVNDTWHEIDRKNGVDPCRYEALYRMVLEDTKDHLPDTKLVLCEPFVAVTGAVTDAWLPEMHIRQRIVHQLAGEFGACFVPFQVALNQVIDRDPESWLADGVHPTLAGHQLLSECWIDTFTDGTL
jgi:lysophospholipase L1-like esterase